MDLRQSDDLQLFSTRDGGSEDYRQSIILTPLGSSAGLPFGEVQVRTFVDTVPSGHVLSRLHPFDAFFPHLNS
jgi:hypothetical protein